MARGRMISKTISLDEKVDSLSDDSARLLWTWLIPHLDREGRMYGDANLFKSIVAPRRHYPLAKVEKYLQEMEKLQLFFRYKVDGNLFLYVKNFEKHQVGYHKEREAESIIPAPSKLNNPQNDGVSTELVRSNSPLIEKKVSLKEEKLIESKERKTAAAALTDNSKDSKVTTETEFLEYLEETRSQYTDLDCEVEFKKFNLWWGKSGRKLKNPKLAWLNWLTKARAIEKENGGNHNGSGIILTEGPSVFKS